MTIAIDFDGTCVTHEYPKVGRTVAGAVDVLKKLVANKHDLILWTMRCDSGVKSGKFHSGLTDAVNWFKENDIPLYGVNCNPSQSEWTQSPKAYAQVYIDDAALGCPLLVDIVSDGMEDIKQVGRPYVDWNEIEKMLILKGIIKETE